MSMTLYQIKAKWEKEKLSYARKEIGDGVQRFVKEVLKSEELFNLKEGLNSTPLERRKNEFKKEETKKGARRADIVIFINSEIIIPVEVEKFGNIEAGKEQILQYQLDWDKKYSILTDGYSWRFYNNNIFREFNLGQILGNAEMFLVFWQEYIKPEFYYLAFFEPQGQQSLLKEMEKLPVEAARQIFFEDITKLIRSLQHKLRIEGYFEDLAKKEREKRAIEITYAYIIQFILYKTLVDNAFEGFGTEFGQTVRTIHDCLKAKQYGKILGVIDGISNKISKNIYRPFSKEQEFITNMLLELIRKPKNELHEVSPWLDIFVFIKKYNFSNVKNEIFGYIYENYLKELYEETQKGQYFTDPAIVNFMLKQVGYAAEPLKARLAQDSDSISLIDPSCGSGTFLYGAINQIVEAVPNGSEKSSNVIERLVNDNIFGLDIAEFPLYLAEMNILMRMLPLIINEKYNNPIDKKIKVFKTRDSIAEFMDTSLRNTINDVNVAYAKNNNQLSLFTEKFNLGYNSYVRDEDDLKEMKRSLEGQPQIPRRRFDFVIGNPPYVGYNECSKQGVLIFELMKQGKARLNDMYGVNLHSIPSGIKKRPPKPNLFAFFIALGLALLKDDGELCYIVPHTILTSGDHDTVRYHLAKFTTIERVITFSGKMFIGRGLKQNRPVATSSLVFVVRRGLPSKLHQVEVYNHKDPNEDLEKCLHDILAGKNINKTKISQSTLLKNAANWNFIKQEKVFLDTYEVYRRNSEDISVYYNHTLAEFRFKARFYFDIGYNIDEKAVSDRPKENLTNYQYPRLSREYWTVKDLRGYWPNIRTGSSKFKIELLQANQGYNSLDSPHKIIWQYANPERFHFTALPVIWARNQICTIGSSNKNELLYLFAILNSPIINTILKSTLKSENEKDYLVSTTAIKEFVRVPKIDQDNLHIKEELIKRAEELLAMEEIALSDLVNFSRVMIQKFDDTMIVGNNLILMKGEEKIRCRIKKDPKLVAKVIENKFRDRQLIKEQRTSLLELKQLPVIDYAKQKLLKDYIDDLVFALYFNVKLPDISPEKRRAIKAAVAKSKFYKVTQQTYG